MMNGYLASEERGVPPEKSTSWIEEESDEGELTVDVYQSPMR